MPKENASSPCDRRKLSTSTVRTMFAAPQAASATTKQQVPTAAALFIGPPQQRSHPAQLLGRYDASLMLLDNPMKAIGGVPCASGGESLPVGPRDQIGRAHV